MYRSHKIYTNTIKSHVMCGGVAIPWVIGVFRLHV